MNLGDLVAFYKEAKARFDESDEFKEIARGEVKSRDCQLFLPPPPGCFSWKPNGLGSNPPRSGMAGFGRGDFNRRDGV